MTTTSNYNRSEIMKVAWQLFRMSVWQGNFSMCLKKAWEFAKYETNRKNTKAAKTGDVACINITLGALVRTDAKASIRANSRFLYGHRY